MSKNHQKDGKKRKFIITQLPEATDPKSEAHKAGYKKISDITIERNKRVLEKIAQEKTEHQAQIAALQATISEQENALTEYQAANPTLPLDKGTKDKTIKKINAKIDDCTTRIATLQTEIERIDAMDKGFKVFKLQKSNFPRVEYAPDPTKTHEENVEGLKKYIRDKEAQLYTMFNRDELTTEILLKKGFQLNYTLTKQEQFKDNDIFHATDGKKELLICLDDVLQESTFEYFKKHIDKKFLVLERALDTTKKWNLKHYMGDNFIAF